VNGYDTVVKTHSEAASLVAANKVDAALGQQAAAHQHGLGFIPLFEERYDLVMPRENEETLLPVLEYIQTAGFRLSLSSLTGYSTSHSGEQVTL
jgi:putative molybdopterin biosynthesis protein